MKTSGYEATEVQCDNGIQAEWDKDDWGINILSNPEDANRIKCSVNFEITLSNYVMYQLVNDPSVIRQEHEETVQTGNNAKVDYRYIGADPNNYVCLEADGDCTEDELYRIVGVMPTQKDESGEYENRVKLIKYTSIGRYYWSGSDTSSSNDWTQSTLNTEVLNGTYWTEISDYQKYIEPAKWYLGGLNWTKFPKREEQYKAERGNLGGGSAPQIINTVANVGLIYLSDYMSPIGEEIENEEQIIQYQKNNYLGNITHYLLTPLSSHAGLVSVAMPNFPSVKNGIGNHNPSSHNNEICPSFYLKVGVKYLSGTGEQSNPYRVTID